MNTIITQPAGQMMGGHSIGILVLNTGYPLLPGNVANATTFDFPVRYKVVEGADSPRLIGGDPTLLEPILAAAEELVRDGCRAIVGACGYFGRFQREIADALPVPVLLSSLCQVPMVLSSIRSSESLGVICAKKSSLDSSVLASVGIAADAPLVIAGMEDSPAFRGAILEDQGWMDATAVEAEAIEAAVRLTTEHPEVRALLLECSDLPPYAKKIQEATGLPVWDFITLIEWVHSGVVKRSFHGFM